MLRWCRGLTPVLHLLGGVRVGSFVHKVEILARDPFLSERGRCISRVDGVCCLKSMPHSHPFALVDSQVSGDVGDFGRTGFGDFNLCGMKEGIRIPNAWWTRVSGALIPHIYPERGAHLTRRNPTSHSRDAAERVSAAVPEFACQNCARKRREARALRKVKAACGALTTVEAGSLAFDAWHDPLHRERAPGRTGASAAQKVKVLTHVLRAAFCAFLRKVLALAPFCARPLSGMGRNRKQERGGVRLAHSAPSDQQPDRVERRGADKRTCSLSHDHAAGLSWSGNGGNRNLARRGSWVAHFR